MTALNQWNGHRWRKWRKVFANDLPCSLARLKILARDGSKAPVFTLQFIQVPCRLELA